MTTAAVAGTPRLKVLVVTAHTQHGGVEQWLVRLLDATGRLDVDAVLLDEDGPLRDELRARGIGVAVLPTGPRGLDLARSSAALTGVLRRRRDVEVVLAVGVKAAAVAAPAARLAGVRLVWAKHDFSHDARLARLLGRASDAVLATSPAVAAATGRTDVAVVPPPRPARPPLPTCPAWDLWHAHGLAESTCLTLGMLARLSPYKGVETAIRAMADPAARAWRLVVAGADDPAAPDERGRLQALAARLGVADRVILLDAVPDAGSALAVFDAVAVLSGVDARGFGREGYSMVALEALAAGVPLVGATGNPEVVRMAGTAGVVVSVDDPHALAQALARLTESDLRHDLGAAGRRLASAHPDDAGCADRVAAVLARVAGRPGAGRADGPPMSVVTCLRNEAGHVDGVLGAVTGLLREDDEYVVVDDGSTDSTGDEIAVWAGKDARVRVVQGPSVGLAAARNAGIAAARHAHLGATDAGCEPVPTWLEALRAPFAEPEPPDLVVGVYDVTASTATERALAASAFPSVAEARRPTPFVRTYGRLLGRAFSPDRMDGRSWAVTREAWRRAGGFDDVVRVTEDAAFGAAVRAAGGTSVLALDAQVTWEQHATLADTARMYRGYGRWPALTGQRPLVARDLVRLAAYPAAAAAVASGPWGRRAVAAGAAAYLSLPLARLARDGAGPRDVALVPVVLAVKDVAKGAGCLQGLWERHVSGGRPG